MKLQFLLRGFTEMNLALRTRIKKTTTSHSLYQPDIPLILVHNDIPNLKESSKNKVLFTTEYDPKDVHKLYVKYNLKKL